MLDSALCPWSYHAGFFPAPVGFCCLSGLHSPCPADGVKDRSPSTDTLNSTWCLWWVSVMSRCCSLGKLTYTLVTGQGSPDPLLQSWAKHLQQCL